ncbi:MAG: metal-dependent hydrolase [Candidatus Harrisonbacteria bacterium CG10_big_fil_rev_8_21_14_0_10_42_17]|uniref:Metal-dependent hydrolase n=1 Tax=Candidatus Harrisonbacteria bacterium CG10_big_fil_rev_8_21_14_0_10_42_17 TaxID=1974584 RepID=A0A2M6WJ56_9BACT|nr:MAG: metal-dependent hydrolase [Candidatus Harrisonbacteria bacterium CG10_big_fil_rev_8_21_14_0_10_42_17]
MKARRLRLAVHRDGSVHFTAPVGMSFFVVERFVHSKRRWLFRKIAFFKTIDTKLVRVFSKKDYLSYKDQALQLIQGRVQHFNSFYDFSFNAISIKNQKTRWGSCSRKGNLNFNYKLLFLPKVQRDYIVVHELCHLKEMNHSMKFWRLVQKTIPNYLNIKKRITKIRVML